MLPPDPNRMQLPSRPHKNGSNGRTHHGHRNDLISAAPEAPSLPPALSGEAMEGAMWQALRHSWLLATIIGLVSTAAVGAAMWFFVPAPYNAQALLQISSHAPRGVFATYESADDFAAYQRTQATLIKSRAVLQAVVRDPKAGHLPELHDRGDPAMWLADNLVVDTTLGPEILRVSLNGPNAEDLPVLVNTTVDAYLREVVNGQRALQQARIEQLMDNHRRFEETLRRKRATLKDLEASLGIDDPRTVALRYQSALQQHAAAEKEALLARLALQNTKTELAAAKARELQPPSVTVSELVIDQYLRQDPVYQRLQMHQAEVREEIERIQGVAAQAVRTSQLEGPQAQLAQTERAIADYRKRVRPMVEAQQIAQAKDEAKTNIAKLESRVNTLQIQETGTAAEVKRLESEVQHLGAAIRQPNKPTSDLEALRDEIAESEQVLKKIGDQVYTLKVEPMVPARVHLLEAADVPTTKTLTKKIKMTGIACFGVFGLAMFGVTWREYRTRRVYAVSDVAQGLGLPMLGVLPALPASARRLATGSKPGGDLYWEAVLHEAVDAIRAHVLHLAQATDARILMVTSAASGEGKTTLAGHLAASLARARHKVLLIDGDTRNPQAHRQFNVPGDAGLVDVLRGEKGFADVVQATVLDRLALLPGGPSDSKALQTLAQKSEASFFAPLLAEFDFIIVDSSPVLPVADALALGQHVDGVIVSVLRQVSRLPAVFAAHQRLGTLGIRVLGDVVIGTTADGSMVPAAYVA